MKKYKYKEYIITVNDSDSLSKKELKAKILKAINKINDSSKVNDIPASAPEIKTSIDYKEPGAKGSLTVETVKEENKRSFAEKKNDVLLEKLQSVLKSAKEDLAKAAVIKSSYSKPVRKKLIAEYTEMARIAKRVDEKLAAELMDLVLKLEDELDLVSWEQPVFTEKDKRYYHSEVEKELDEKEKRRAELKKAGKEVEDSCETKDAEEYTIEDLKQDIEEFNDTHKIELKEYIIEKAKKLGVKEEFLRKYADVELFDSCKTKDSLMASGYEPVFLVSKAKLAESYENAKNGINIRAFINNLEKVQKDMSADYLRIMNGADTYLENFPQSVLESIIKYYNTAVLFAKDLQSLSPEIKEIAQDLETSIKEIKRGWDLVNYDYDEISGPIRKAWSGERPESWTREELEKKAARKAK